MTIEQIERFMSDARNDKTAPAKIFFKTRNTVEGVFIQATDFAELKRKNFWRVVSAKNLEDYRTSKDINLSRIFNGAEFTKLAPQKS
jgi:hypothetical protein